MKLISWSWIMMKLISKKAWKKKKGTSIAWYIICKIYSYQKICTIWFFVVSDEVTSTNSQIFEQIEVIPGVVLKECLSWMTQYQRRNKETLNAIENCVKEQLIPQFYKIVFHLFQYFYHAMKKKQLKKNKQAMHIIAWSYCLQRLFQCFHCFMIFICHYISQFNDGKN